MASVRLLVPLFSAVLALLSGAAWAQDVPQGYWDVQGDDRLPLIRQMIEEKGLCWVAGPTSVSDLTDEQKQALLGGIPDDLGAAPVDPTLGFKDARDLPAVFDWRLTLKCTSAANQGDCGSCWLHGPVAALESALLIYEDQRFDLSQQQILSCVSQGWGCNGGQPSAALNHLVGYGAVLESCMPYEQDDTVPCTEDACEVITHLDAYYSVPRTVNDIKQAVYTYGPVSAGIYAFDDLFSYQEGCYENTDTHDTNHVITIVGWDDTQCGGAGAWIIKNSWGENWGISGFAYIKYGTTGIGRGTYRLEYTPKMHLLKAAGCTVDAGGRGSGNAFLEPGETARLAVTLANDGKGSAQGMSAVLRSSTPGVTITDSTADFSDIGPESSGSTVVPHFEVALDGGLVAGDWVEFELAVTTGTRAATISFPLAVGTYEEVLTDDFEADLGWTVGAPGDNATEGLWERVVPNEKLTNQYTGAVVQVGKDETPFPGTVCFVTENSPIGTKQRFGDVDGGRTTLLSPVLDLSGYDRALLTYQRFYSNDTMPGQSDGDPFVVDVSNDGGATWVNLETLTETPQDRVFHRSTLDLGAAVDLTNAVQVRFVAQDIGAYNSVVEAAVDDVEVLGFRSLSPAAEGPRLGPRAPAGLYLGQNVPNPFNPETVIPFGMPSGGRVEVGVYNIRGQRVRELVDAWMPAGFHDVSWDGRDEGGRPVSSGVYFYRLESDRGTVTRRMTLIQ